MRLASNESPFPPLPAVREAIERARSARSTAIPTRPTRCCAQRSRERYDVPAARIAIGNGSCDILLAAGEALLEPGAEVVYAWPSFSVYPHLAPPRGRARSRSPLDGEAAPRPAGDAARDHRRDPAGDRVQPQQPHQHRARARATSPGSSREVPAQVCVILDEAYCEFNLLDDPDASVELLDRHPNLVLLRTFSKVHGLCGLRVGFALCGSERAAARGRPGAPAVLLQRARPGRRRSRRCAHQDAVIERVTRTVAERISVRRAAARARPEPADSQANFCWFALGEERDEAEVMRGPGRARRARARRRRARRRAGPRCA